MRKHTPNAPLIINPQLIAAIAAMEHTDTLVIADSGLPFSHLSGVIDLSLVGGHPRFVDVLRAVRNELVIEELTYAEETDTHPEVNREVRAAIRDLGATVKKVNHPTHEEFKAQVLEARVVIRTGEQTPYANVILHGGVPF